MDPVVARFRWTADDLFTGRKYFSRVSRFRYWWTVAPILILLPLIYFSSASDHRRFQEGLIFMIGLIGFAVFIAVFLTLKVISPYLLRREFNQRPDANSEVVLTFTKDKIFIQSPVSDAEIQWSAFYKIFSAPEGFLFLTDSRIFHFIPRRAFVTEVESEKLKILAHQHAKEFKELK